MSLKPHTAQVPFCSADHKIRNVVTLDRWRKMLTQCLTRHITGDVHGCTAQCGSHNLFLISWMCGECAILNPIPTTPESLTAVLDPLLPMEQYFRCKSARWYSVPNPVDAPACLRRALRSNFESSASIRCRLGPLRCATWVVTSFSLARSVGRTQSCFNCGPTTAIEGNRGSQESHQPRS